MYPFHFNSIHSNDSQYIKYHKMSVILSQIFKQKVYLITSTFLTSRPLSQCAKTAKFLYLVFTYLVLSLDKRRLSLRCFQRLKTLSVKPQFLFHRLRSRSCMQLKWFQKLDTYENLIAYFKLKKLLALTLYKNFN